MGSQPARLIERTMNMSEQNARPHNCGGHLHRRLVEVPITLRGVTATVSREEWVCDSCDETRVSLAAAEQAEAEAFELVRRDPTALGFLAGEKQEPSVEPEERYGEWPSWTCLPSTLRDRLSMRAEAEGTPLLSTELDTSEWAPPEEYNALIRSLRLKNIRMVSGSFHSDERSTGRKASIAAEIESTARFESHEDGFI